MDYVELNLPEQMKYAKSSSWETRIHFATYPAILPEVADFMIENEKDRDPPGHGLFACMKGYFFTVRGISKT